MDDTRDDSPNDDGQSPPARRSLWRKLAVVAAVGGLAALAWWQFGDYFSLNALAERESRLIDAARRNPLLILGAAFLLYVAITAFSLPAAAVFTMGIGWLCMKMFGDGYGQPAALAIAVALVSFASTAGATLAFLMSRYLFRDTIQRKFGDSLRKFNEALQREGAFYLFTLRLIPAVPFFVINVVMGLTPIRTWTYWWVSQIGMLPGTAVYVYAGTQVPGLRELSEKGAGGVLDLQLFVAFALLGLFPLAAKKLMARFRPKAPGLEN